MSVALCIPAYNAESYISRLLDSARKQFIPFDEILVYDDCSTDQTAALAERLGAKVIKGDRNRGCSYGKNELAKNASSDWIHFHDADDELYPNFTTLAHAWLNRPDCPDVVLFDYEYKDNETLELLGKSDFNDAALREDPVRYTIQQQINPFCGLYNRERLLSVGGYDIDPAILYNEDVAFHCKLAIAGFSFRAEKTICIINYRIGNSMSSANQLKCAQAHFQVMKRNAEKVGDRYAPEIAEKLWKNAIICASLNDTATSRLASSLSYHLDPEVISQEGFLVKSLSKVKPFYGIMFREYMIRMFKPQLRK